MRPITVTDTLNLSLPERIMLVEDIWDSIAAEAESLEITEEEKRIIVERLEAYHRDPKAVSPWKEVYERIVKPHEP
jgi:putative addiction module component (TIGR02574 family)